MKNRIIFLVEDNPDDELLTLRALKKSNVKGDIVVVHDGVEALDYLFCTGSYRGKNLSLPEVVLLNLRLPRVDGVEVLYRIRSNDRTKQLPVVILASSKEEQEFITSYNFGANTCIRKPIDCKQFTEAVKHLGIHWPVLNEPVVENH